VSAEHDRCLPPTAVAAVPAEPSWGRVLATTVDLWVSRRLGRAASFVRPRRSGRRSEKRVGRRPWTGRRWRLGFWKLLTALVAAAAVVAALQIAGVFSRTASPVVRSPSAQPGGTRAVSARPAAVTQAEAGAWIAGQVSDNAIVGCSPAMCAALQADGVSASQLVSLGPGLGGALAADVIVTSPSVGKELVDKYAPGLIASFGSGASRIEVRAVARGGAAAFEAAMRSDFTARKSAGTELLQNQNIKFTASDAARLRAGEVDSRLLATLATLSSLYEFRVTSFGDAAPGAQLLFRDVTITSYRKGSGAADLSAALALVNEQSRPYLPAYSAIVRLQTGQSALRVEFAEPSPLGLLTTAVTDER